MSVLSSMSAASSMHGERGESGEPPRKRVRKGTKSCWECKRRKIRCQLSTENVSVCAGCLSRGTTCLSQEYPEEYDTSGGPQVGERLGRVEMLLEKLVAKIESYEEEENAQKINTPESMGGNDVLTPYATNIGSTSSDAPILSLFDNELIGRRDNISQSQINTPASQSTGSKTPSCRMSKNDRLRQTLIELFPSQEDINLITKESNCWLIFYAMNQRAGSKGSSGDMRNCLMLSTFSLTELRKSQPIFIARSLLYIAVCLQQLPSDFDVSRLHLSPSIEARMDRYISTVQGLITSDDELVSSIEGLECLILQGMYHINGGSPRRAWLTFRRALNVGQLMGIHRGPEVVEGGRDMWHQIVQADRYLALLLGLPSGSADSPLLLNEAFQNPDSNKDIAFARKVSSIAGRIIERNQAESTQAYATTQEIDERMDNLAKEMPHSWWAIQQTTGDHETINAVLHRTMTQIWYFQLEALLHLPFMLRAATERRYEYSKFSCLKASREVVLRYLALRDKGYKSFCCKIVDFGALTATVTLLLGLLEPTQGFESGPKEENDRVLISNVLNRMEEMSSNGRDVMATQSVNVIKTLLAIDASPASVAGNLRVSIPYFGTVNITRAPPTPTSNGIANFAVMPHQEHDSGQQAASLVWPEPNAPSQAEIYCNAPMVSFHSTQFPAALVPELPIEEWALQDSDTFFFDSLLHTDLEGNWMF